MLTEQQYKDHCTKIGLDQMSGEPDHHNCRSTFAHKILVKTAKDLNNGIESPYYKKLFKSIKSTVFSNKN